MHSVEPQKEESEKGMRHTEVCEQVGIKNNLLTTSA